MRPWPAEKKATTPRATRCCLGLLPNPAAPHTLYVFFFCYYYKGCEPWTARRFMLPRVRSANHSIVPPHRSPRLACSLGGKGGRRRRVGRREAAAAVSGIPRLLSTPQGPEAGGSREPGFVMWSQGGMDCTPPGHVLCMYCTYCMVGYGGCRSPESRKRRWEGISILHAIVRPSEPAGTVPAASYLLAFATYHIVYPGR